MKRFALVPILLVVLFVLAVPALAANGSQDPDWGTLLAGPLVGFLQVLLSATTIAVVLERIPGWDKVPANVKLSVVGSLNVLAPFVLQLITTNAPSDVLQQPAIKVLLGIVGAAISFVAHQVDLWVTANAQSAKIDVLEVARMAANSTAGKVTILLLACVTAAMFAILPGWQLSEASAQSPFSVSNYLMGEQYLRCVAYEAGMPTSLAVEFKMEFDYNFGFQHGITTPDQWRATYGDRIQQYTDLLGLPNPTDRDGNPKPWCGRLIRAQALLSTVSP